jgi:hypothetical protein
MIAVFLHARGVQRFCPRSLFPLLSTPSRGNKPPRTRTREFRPPLLGFPRTQMKKGQDFSPFFLFFIIFFQVFEFRTNSKGNLENMKRNGNVFQISLRKNEKE